MYPYLLFAHSWLRWLILLFAVIVILTSLQGWLSKKNYTKSDNRNAAIFVGFMHLQLLLGLILYFISPFVKLDDFGKVMGNSQDRFWAVEHISIMILAVIIAQLGRTFSKKAKTDLKKHRTMAIYTIISLVLILSLIPWNEAGRLFRGL